MISELISKLFCVRDCAHYAHWTTSSGYHHGVLGEIYDQVVDYADRIMEAYIGNFNTVPTVKTKGYTFSNDKDILKCLEEDVVWIAENQEKIAEEVEAIEAIIDELVEFYLSNIFKLKHLK